MFDHPYYFRLPQGCGAAMLPFDLAEVIADWSSLRSPLVRAKPEAFRRSEWAWLISQLEPEALSGFLRESLGSPVAEPPAPVSRIFRPRGTLAVWLPGNVSLLGPLITVMLTLTGNRLWLKSGSGAADLTGEFLSRALDRLRPGPLRRLLESNVRCEVFDRTDARNREWATEADLRIVFGSDEAASGIHGHAPARASISFTDRQSVVWIERECIERSPDVAVTLESLVRVCNVYGTAGCTSPRAVMLLGGDVGAATALRDRLARMWSAVVRERPPMHVASANVLCLQTALAHGWDAVGTDGHLAVLAAGPATLPLAEGPMFLPVVPATLDEAVAALPRNIQTVGHALADASSPVWLRVLANTAVKRFVPVARMHDFGATWDGCGFLRGCFEEIEVRA